jgi:hypothetical protein
MIVVGNICVVHSNGACWIVNMLCFNAFWRTHFLIEYSLIACRWWRVGLALCRLLIHREPPMAVEAPYLKLSLVWWTELLKVS